MGDPTFFIREAALSVDDVVTLTGAARPEGVDGSRTFDGVAPLDRANASDISFIDNPSYLKTLATTRAGAVLVAPKFADRVPVGIIALVVREPYRAFAQVMARFYPSAMRPGTIHEGRGVSPSAIVHPHARLEPNVAVDPGAVIGPHAEIGSGTTIAANAVIGAGVRIGRDCSIGPNTTLQHCLIGNRVIIHPGAQIGQDGFGFSMGPNGHLKVPQVGRVVIQDDVEIGAGTAIDRGANRDTIIGEGTKIDNQVQIGHNVEIGRHCVIVGKVGIAGSAVLEDFVVIGGAAGVVGHVRIGRGSQVAGASHVKDDLPPGGRYGGSPAQPFRDWARELAAIRRLGKVGRSEDNG